MQMTQKAAEVAEYDLMTEWGLTPPPPPFCE